MKELDELEISESFLLSDEKAIGVFDPFCQTKQEFMSVKCKSDIWRTVSILFSCLHLHSLSLKRRTDFNTRLNFEIMSVNCGETFDPRG